VSSRAADRDRPRHRGRVENAPPDHGRRVIVHVSVYDVLASCPPIIGAARAGAMLPTVIGPVVLGPSPFPLVCQRE